jgi:hypothetical protein
MKLITAFLSSALLTLPVGAQTARVPHQEFLDVRDFGAVCDNHSDDSLALQKTISAGIEKGQPVYVPAATCLHKSTLVMNNGSKSVSLMGAPFLSVLKYSGAGSGWFWKNGDGRPFIYNPVVLGVSFRCGNPAGCAKGIEAYSLSEGVFRDVTIGQSDGAFATGWFCSGCNIMNLDHLVLSAQGTAITAAIGLDCAGCSAVIIRSGDFFCFSAATLRFSGPTTHIVIDANWFEGQDKAILFDDSASGGSVSSDLIAIANNRFLFNGAGGSLPKRNTYTNQVALFLQNTGTKWMIMTGIVFGPGNSFYCASGLCSTATPIVVSISQQTGAQTAIDLTVRDNTFRGAGAGLVSSNNRKVVIDLENNRARDQTDKPVTSTVVGIATMNSGK